MPPKVKVAKADIVSAALDLLRTGGEASINARSIAGVLGCSTQPIFSNFATMEQLQAAVEAAAYDHYLQFLKQEAESGRYPRYKAFGMAYIRFAYEEKALFRLLFLCDRKGENAPPTPDFQASVELLQSSLGLSKEAAERMHLQLWFFVHGIGTMLATGFAQPDWEQISALITDVYQGLRARYTGEVPR
jgi:AcrR family transcriptional regulator